MPGISEANASTSERTPDGSQPGDAHLMMTSPGFWAAYPILPLIRQRRDGGMPDTGVLYYDTTDDGENLMRFQNDCNMWYITTEELKRAPIADIDKLISEGWVVD